MVGLLVSFCKDGFGSGSFGGGFSNGTNCGNGGGIGCGSGSSNGTGFVASCSGRTACGFPFSLYF